MLPAISTCDMIQPPRCRRRHGILRRCITRVAGWSVGSLSAGWVIVVSAVVAYCLPNLQSTSEACLAGTNHASGEGTPSRGARTHFPTFTDHHTRIDFVTSPAMSGAMPLWQSMQVLPSSGPGMPRHARRPCFVKSIDS